MTSYWDIAFIGGKGVINGSGAGVVSDFTLLGEQRASLVIAAGVHLHFVSLAQSDLRSCPGVISRGSSSSHDQFLLRPANKSVP